MEEVGPKGYSMNYLDPNVVQDFYCYQGTMSKRIEETRDKRQYVRQTLDDQLINKLVEVGE